MAMRCTLPSPTQSQAAAFHFVAATVSSQIPNAQTVHVPEYSSHLRLADDRLTSHSVVFRILTLTAHSTALFPYCILAASPPISSTGSQRAHLRCHGAIDNPVQCAGQVQDGQGDKRPAWPCHHPEAVSGSLHLRNPHLYMPY